VLARNYPREFRYTMYSSPLPASTNCAVCHARALTGITGLPAASHLVIAPYASTQHVSQAQQSGQPVPNGITDMRLGADIKWNPSSDTTLDGTVNPDFSQVEADTAQIAVNSRFALFVTEKRPFFLEGVDLFQTPIQAVYTRTITSPRWGGRVTGKQGRDSYTLLVAQDKGGGSVVIPGPAGSRFAPQDFTSLVGVARWRRDLGGSFLGVLYTGRNIEGGGHNHVVGPDFQWRPNDRDVVRGQVLVSDTNNPRRPDLSDVWDGQHSFSHAFDLSYQRTARHFQWSAAFLDFGNGFRAEDGFVPQVGYREWQAVLGRTFWPSGILSRVNAQISVDYATDRSGRLITRRAAPALQLGGRWNLVAEVALNIDRLNAAGRDLPRTQVAYSIQADPSRRVARLGVSGFLGEDVDFVNGRTGRGGSVNGVATIRLSDHVAVDVNSDIAWLGVPSAVSGGRRLFTAEVQRLKATYNVSSKVFLRLVGQYVSIRRDPALYVTDVPARTRGLSLSGLLCYRRNWQTALYLGYGEERDGTPADRLVPVSHQIFAKASYGFQR
jgi:hypothetical protein